LRIVYDEASLDPADVIKSLVLTGLAEATFAETACRREIIRQARELGLVAAVDEVQAFADNFRIGRDLLTPEEMFAFLKKSGLTPEDFETFCEAEVLARAFRRHLADDERIQQYFVAHRHEFDRARASIITVSSSELANEIVMRVREDGEDFHQLARQYSQDEESRYNGGHLGLVGRADLSCEASARVFAAEPGAVIGPFQEEQGIQVFLAEDVRKAQSPELFRDEIEARILDEWQAQFLRNGFRVEP